MQFEGATELEMKLSSVIGRCERELPASTLETDIVVALSDAANELQRLRGHWPPQSDSSLIVQLRRAYNQRDDAAFERGLDRLYQKLRDGSTP